MAASEAKLGMVWCWLQHQKETRTRGAASPRSASPMGPAPTRLPRMALPLLTDHPLVTNTPTAAMAAAATQCLSKIPSATMQTNQMMPVATVIRSRFRSTTDDEPRDDEMPPPNRSDRPPPLPLCRSTSSTISRLVMIRITENATVTVVTRLYLGGGGRKAPPKAHGGRRPHADHDTGRFSRTRWHQGLHHLLAPRRRPARP